ncbi:LuxR family transcriptional regulator [Streptomyces sp. SID13666]|uniref:cupin domain-containing protein n=1 Tax=unclassified Streptomyces TaxID=2593676 RepID=UPI0013C16FA1|nr:MULTISPECIES: cupin domain-containing protein [unclassified Streptomyces]MCZ4097455.1 cupin domain-containing protein [Streptomyces sp. H39-C1]NEA53934.1 LuxR family transcriptional regulator [Streptomyces sp. SID13666]
MQKFSLDAKVREHLQRAASAASGRSAETVYGGHEHVLRQTLVALEAGKSLTEHENPGEATLFVLHGRVRLQSDEASWDGMSGDMIVVPPVRHSLEALERAAVLLTVVKHR